MSLKLKYSFVAEREDRMRERAREREYEREGEVVRYVRTIEQICSNKGASLQLNKNLC